MPGLVGSCGETNTAPSGLSAPVTAPAVKGNAIGAPGVSGPEVATGARVEGVAGAVVADEASLVVVCPDPFEPALGDDGLELHDASSTASAAAVPATLQAPDWSPAHRAQYGVRTARLPFGPW